MSRDGERGAAPRDPAQALIQQIEDAALQHWFIRAREADRANAQAHGWTFRYAVGTDVLMQHAEPAESATQGQDMAVGGGEVFRDDPPEVKTNIAAALAAVICFDLDRERPLLLIPPMNLQVRRNIAALGRKFLAAGVLDPSRIEEWAREFEQRGAVLTESEAALIRDMTLVDGSRALARMRGLLDAGRVLSLDAGPLPPSFDDDFRHALRPPFGQEEHRMQAERVAAWTRTLLGFRGAGRNLLEVAETLARLEMFNQRLATASDGRKRLLLITGDSSLLDAARLVDGPGGESFADAFLRHPRAYLDEPGVVRPKDEGAAAPGSHARASEVLAVCLGRFHDVQDPLGPPQGGRITLPPHLQEQIAGVARSDPEAHRRTRRRWLSVARASTRFEPPELYLDQLRGAMDRPDRLREELDRLRPKIAEDVGKAWDSFFEVTVELRFVIEVWANQRPMARMLPWLCFEQLPQVDAFFAEARGWLRDPGSFSMRRYRALRAGLDTPEDGAAHDRARYFSFLAHGWLLASQGQWRSAAILANRAVAAGRQDRDPQPGGVNGREASYFAAFARRHVAERRADLGGLGDLLDAAEAIARAERRPTEGGDWPLDVVPERFAAERLALRLSDLLFAWNEAEEAGQVEGARRALALIGAMTEDIWRFTAAIEENLDRQERIAAAFAAAGRELPAYQPGREIRRQIRLQLLRRAWRNLFGIGLMVPGSLATARRAWDCLSADRPRMDGQDDAAGGAEDMAFSSFAQLVSTCATRLFAPEESERARAGEGLAHLLAGLRKATSGAPGPDNLLVFRYDRLRFIRWIEAALRGAPGGR